jgi:hypothetical protein
MYHEKIISLVKNVVHGKRIFKGGKEYSLGKFFSTFLSLKGPRQVKS